MTELLSTPAARGLSAAEVADRVARGEVNGVPARSSRSVTDILRGNLLTFFNALLGSLFVVIMIVGPPQDALFGIVLVVNTLIGVVEEVRAKRTLDRLAILSAPKARVVRDGAVADLPVNAVVLDDLLVIGPGDQVVVDAVVVSGTGLEVDESLLTGESEPVVKRPDDRLLSGSFVVAGSGRCRAVQVGESTYAAALAAEARRFSLARSELRVGINRILRSVTWVLVPLGALLFASQLGVHTSVASALRAAVGGVVAMVPEGLVLLTSVAFAVAVTRLTRDRVLVQELAAVETLARVDIVCVDKTGTLTEGRLEVSEVEVLDAGADVARGLPALVSADASANATGRAIAAFYDDRSIDSAEWQPTGTVPFSSARKWSAASFANGTTWLLGAPDVLLADGEPLLERVHAAAAEGRRMVLVATADGPAFADAALPALHPAALVTLHERLRPDAAETLAYFAAQGVDVKVISGDHPSTVASVARRLGLAGHGPPVDARSLPEGREALAAVMDEHSIFGRVTPAQKRGMVAALQSRGHVVAMTGDGVNDVLALKDADLGVAMGSGSAASRAVAQVVLLDSTFAVLPKVLGEGRRVIANIERVAQLFLTKTVYATLLAFAVGVGNMPFPFLPRHLTLVASLTIGTPAFFLSLAPNARRARPHFVRRVLRFAVPAGIIAAATTFGLYEMALDRTDVSRTQAQTMATLVLVSLGLWVLTLLARPLTPWRAALVATMAGGAALTVALPWLRSFFALAIPPADLLAVGATVVAASGLALEIVARLLRRWSPDLV